MNVNSIYLNFKKQYLKLHLHTKYYAKVEILSKLS